MSTPWDADGFLSKRGGDTFVYSPSVELLKIAREGPVDVYAYDGVGRRVARTEGAAKTKHDLPAIRPTRGR